MTTEHESWLKLVVEEPLDPALPICDPHHHLGESLDIHYFLPELLADLGAGHNVTHTVFVECSQSYRQSGPEEMRPVGETEFVQGVAAENARRRDSKASVAAGIVGFADLTLGDRVAPVLEAHIQAGRGRFRGIRQSCAWDASPNIKPYMRPPKGRLADPRFRQGLARLQEKGLSFDALLYHTQLMELAYLARAFPGLSIILNHIGYPLGIGPYAGRREEVFQVWKRGITEIAACKNVYVKLGGLGMRAIGFGWHERPKPPSSEELAKAWSPYYLFCIEKFGTDRCMFESNFPVDRISCSYAVLWNAFKRVAQGFSPSERAALFRGTAMRAYRLQAGSRKRA
jgi:predicted TIM-barrel fold metal-dependent hydrolase